MAGLYKDYRPPLPHGFSALQGRKLPAFCYVILSPFLFRNSFLTFPCPDTVYRLLCHKVMARGWLARSGSVPLKNLHPAGRIQTSGFVGNLAGQAAFLPGYSGIKRRNIPCATGDGIKKKSFRETENLKGSHPPAQGSRINFKCHENNESEMDRPMSEIHVCILRLLAN